MSCWMPPSTRAESFIARSSEGWPFITRYLLIQPLYRGKKVPDTIKARRELFAGGIWVSLDPADLVYESDGDPLEGNLGLTLMAGDYVVEDHNQQCPCFVAIGHRSRVCDLDK